VWVVGLVAIDKVIDIFSEIFSSSQKNSIFNIVIIILNAEMFDVSSCAPKQYSRLPVF
jgi:hypothetical protein